MEIGTIVELSDRHFGYIRRKGIKENLFFHADALSGVAFSALKKGDKLSFAVTNSLKGPYATRVSRL